jgi:ABC-type multidrug transport system ATPase subunit/pSer/pThr/pTyr-binding forkhead associated (FHA) protein
MRVRVQLPEPNGKTRTFEAVGPSIRLGRDAACEVAVDPVAFSMVSGTHARIEPVSGGFALVHLSHSNKTLVNDALIDGPVRLKAGDRVRLGFTGPTITIVAIEQMQDGPAADVRFDSTMKVDSRHLALLRGTARAQRIEIGKGGVIGRTARSVQFHLDHPHVSGLHANLAVEGERVVLADLGSSNGTFLNGRRLMRPTVLKPGDRIDIGPFSLQFDGPYLVSRSRSNNIELVARGLKRVVQDRSTGQPLKLLDHISLVIRPKEFVCLLGPSGSGKSTLLAILSGRHPPDIGAVTLNGQDLYAHFEVLKEDIAVVPQKDVLHESLSLANALRYTAELRLPPDITSDEVEASVADILDVVGLTSRRDMLIRYLSGGQVKRASLANELVARPSLLFLDEVTSGLDEQTDREVMELFRQVADGGKTVVCITHSLANVEATCHLVVMLTEGGRLAFIGSPDEAKAYFQISRLGDVYSKLALEQPDEWHNRFRSSPYFSYYVVDRMPSDLDSEPEEPAAARPAHGNAKSIRQASVLTRRYVSIWRGDRNALWALFGQSLLVALLLGLAFGSLGAMSSPRERAQKAENLLLLLAVSCFWFGCNTAAKELVKERVIFLRERDFNLRVDSYFSSKFLVLTLIGVMQTTLLFGVVWVWCRPPGVPALVWVTLVALAIAGTAIGLTISAVAQSEEVATALVPIAVIPQIILAGVITRLSGMAQLIANGLITVYWGQLALERLLPTNDLRLLAREEGNWFYPWAIVLAHAVVGAAATMGVLWRTQGRRGSR